MALNSWQLISWVLPGKPFGTGADGNYNSSTVPPMTYLTLTGTVGNTTINVSANSVPNGSILKLVQQQGTGAGNNEIVKVISGGGTTTFIISKPLKYSYTASASDHAQAIKIPMYRDVVIPSGTWSPTAWNGSVGGELIFACKSLTPTGSISANGLGFVGGVSGAVSSVTAGQGESYTGTEGRTKTANGGGGGTEKAQNEGASNGDGGSYGSLGTGTNRGNIYGDSELLASHLGSGGGGGDGVIGGKGGGLITIFAETMTAPTGISSIGGNAQDSTYDGGGGSGGGILICGGTVDIGTNKLSVIGATSTLYDGGAGRIAVYYGKTLAGSVSASYYGTLTSEQDPNLIEPGGNILLAML